MALIRVNHQAEPPPCVATLTREQCVLQLQSSDVSLRRQAARELASHPDSTSLLCEHLSNESNLTVRSIIFSALIAHQSPSVAADLLCMLCSEDANLRGGAIEALQEMPEQVAPHIEAMLADPDSDVRIGVVAILAALRHPKVPGWLQAVVVTDPHVNVCAAAIDALAEVGEPEVIPDLRALAKRFAEVAFIQFAVDAASRRILGR